MHVGLKLFPWITTGNPEAEESDDLLPVHQACVQPSCAPVAVLPFEFDWLQLYDAEVKKSILHTQLWIGGRIHTSLRSCFEGKILPCLDSTISVLGLRRQDFIVELG